MTTQTEVQPATVLPRDAKPSEIIRGWPENRWTKNKFRTYCSGRSSYCSIGILAELGGFDWSIPTTEWTQSKINGATFDPVNFVANTYDLPQYAVQRVIALNDTEGKNAAADYLEQLGY